jgi:hypothetical protein
MHIDFNSTMSFSVSTCAAVFKKSAASLPRVWCARYEKPQAECSFDADTPALEDVLLGIDVGT